MRIFKGLLLGIWLFSFATLAYLYISISRGLPSGQGAVGVEVITYLTTHNALWWLALVGCFAIGLLITRSWTGKPALWIALCVTELFPVGLLMLFLLLVARNKEMIDRLAK